MHEQNLALNIEELMDRMARIQEELASLKQKATALPQLNPNPDSTSPGFTLTRRKTLKRLGLALLGVSVAASAVGFAPAHAKLVANPGTSKVGAMVVSPLSATPYGAPAASSNAGLVAVSDATHFNLADLPFGNTGVYGNGFNNGVYGKSGNNGVYGSGLNGVFGNGSNSGVYGSGAEIGVNGTSPKKGVYAAGTIYGVYSTSAYHGVYGEGKVGGVEGHGTSNDGTGAGIFGSHESGGYSGVFTTSIWVNGFVYAGAKPFKIDHPLDPANKCLHHVSVESPEMKTLYDGIATMDGQGAATIELPRWFEALNTAFRYQLTSLGVAMPGLFVAGEIAEGRFKIAGGLPGQKVSWQVTGVRQDAWARANPLPVEVEKSKSEKGLYFHPEAFGLPKEKSLSTLFKK